MQILYHWGQTAAKEERAQLEQPILSISSATLTVSGWKNNRVVYIASSESSEAKRYAQRWNKTERKYTNQTMGFVGRMDHKVAKCRIVIHMKKCCWTSLTE